MDIGVPMEIKANEGRVGLTPDSVAELSGRGHKVFIESGAGRGIQCADADYVRAGAKIVASPEEVFARGQMVVKVKEPQPSECSLLRRGQILFTYLHLAANPVLAKELMRSGVTAVAYETVTSQERTLPLLTPMSEVAGRLSVQAGAQALEREHGGAGVLLGGVPGVQPARVVIIGGGVVGTNAAQIALGMRAEVVVLDKSLASLRQLDEVFGGHATLVHANTQTVERHVVDADLVIGSVLIPGACAPKLVDAGLVKRMKSGAALVDVAIDQGGCFATSQPTTHGDPTYVKHEVVHYCVDNMPGAVAKTSTYALNNATLSYVLNIADQGLDELLNSDPHLRNGLNVQNGRIVQPQVAQALGFTPAEVAA